MGLLTFMRYRMNTHSTTRLGRFALLLCAMGTLGGLSAGCADTKLNYKCTCTQIAYNVDGTGENIDRSFSENVCDTYENIEQAFGINGEVYNALETCESEMGALSDEYECECDCYYQSEC